MSSQISGTTGQGFPRLYQSKIVRLMVALVSAIAMLVAVFFAAPRVTYAVELSDNIITDASLTKKEVNSNGSTTDLVMNFKLPNNKIKAGDTSTISLPEGFVFNRSIDFDVKSSDGNVVAHAHMDEKTGKLTMTYTDYVEKNSDITGRIVASVKADKQHNTNYTTTPFNIDVNGHTVNAGEITYGKWTGDNPEEVLSKWASINVTDNTLQYWVRINGKGIDLHGVTISDQLKSTGMTYDKDSFTFIEGKFFINKAGGLEMNGGRDVTSRYKDAIKFNDTNTAFSVPLGDIGTNGYYIKYTVKLNHTPVNHEAFDNKIRMTYPGQTEKHEYTNRTTWETASGEANGYNYSIKINKKGEDGKALAGAKFTVTRDRSGETVGTMTTDANGAASLENLLRDDYTLTETEAPAGYQKADPVKVTADELNNEAKSYSVCITDRVTDTSVKVVKKWDDADNQDGKRPSSVKVQLYADGQTSGEPVVLNTANGWSHEFTGLKEYNQGQRIVYTVKEVDAPEGYTATVSGSAADGFTITNKHTPAVTSLSGSKTWNDKDDQDGKRPGSITVNLLADGRKVKSVKATAAGGWKYSFADVPVYANGRKIVYTVSEDPVKGYTPSVKGLDIENSYTPGQTSVSVVKKWDDANNQDGVRPASVKVQLYADGQASGSPVVLNAANEWTYRFTGLAVNKAGRKIAYTVKEVDAAQGYTATVSGSAADGFTITNKHTPVVPPTPRKPSKPVTPRHPVLAKTGVNAMVFAIASLALLLTAGVALSLRRRLQ